MAMSALHNAAKHSIIMKFILGGFMFLAVGGLVFMDIGGYFRGGLNTTTIAVVDDTKIDIRDFDNVLRGVLMQGNITPKQAYDLGVVNAVLDAQIDDILKAKTAIKLNLNISNDAVASRLQQMIALQVPAGTNIKEHVEMLLRSQGISENQVASSIRTQMQTAILDNLPMGIVNYIPSFVANTYGKIEAEKRSGQIIILSTDKLITKTIEVTEHEIEEYYDNNMEQFIIPDERIITIGQMTPDMIKKSIPHINDDNLRAIYQERANEFTLPSKRLISQAVFRDETQAQAVFDAAVTNKESLKTALQSVTGSTQEYRPPVAYAVDDLPNVLSAMAFDSSIKEGDIIAPIKTALGWHILEIQSLIEQRQQDYDEIKEKLRKEVETKAIYDVLYDKMTTAENMQDAGDDFSVIAREIGLKISKTKSITRSISTDTLPEPMKTVVTDAPELISELFELEEGQSIYPIETDDEGFIIFGVESIKPQQYRSLVDVRDAITRDIKAARHNQLARSALDKIVESLNKGEISLDSVIRDYNGKKQDFNNVDRYSESYDTAIIFTTATTTFNPYIKDEGNYGIVTVNAVNRNVEDYNPGKATEHMKSIYHSAMNILDRHFIRNNVKIRVNDGLLRQQYGGVIIE